MAFSRIAAATVLAGSLIVGTTGCTFVSPVATQRAYQPADGINVNLGDVRVRNLRVFQERGQKMGFIVGSFVNSGDKDGGITITYEDSNEVQQRVHIAVPSGEKVDVGYNGGAPIKENIDVDPGARAEMTISNDDNYWKAVLVPVLELPTGAAAK
jgi:hypothetical protein